MATFNTITVPTAEPVSLDELKDSIRIDGTSEDARLLGLIIAARQFAEDYLDIRIMSQVVDFTLDKFPADEFSLHMFPIQSVDSVKYDNTASPSVETTLTVNTDYRVDIVNKNGRIISNGGWPSVYNKFNSVRIRMTVGYADSDAVPAGIKEGIKLYAAGLYESNECLMQAAKGVLWPFRNVQQWAV